MECQHRMNIETRMWWTDSRHALQRRHLHWYCCSVLFTVAVQIVCRLWNTVSDSVFDSKKHFSSGNSSTGSEVYGPSAMSGSKVLKWVRAFKDGREKVHDKRQLGQPSVITEDLVNYVNEKILEDRRFTISTLALEFPNVGRTTFHKIVSENL